MIVFLGLFLVKDHATRCGIETSRLAVIESIADRGETFIDNSIFETPDKVEIDSHYYGDKPPLLVMAATVWYGFLKILGISFAQNQGLAIWAVNGLFFLLTLLIAPCFYLQLKKLNPKSPDSYCANMAILAVCSTLVLSYSVTLNNHTICALLLLLLQFLLMRSEKNCSWRNAFLAGILTGTIFNLDFVIGGVFGISVFFFYSTQKLDFRLKLRCLSVYAAGAIALLLIEAFMNYCIYASPLPLYLISHKPAIFSKNVFWYGFHVLFGFKGFFLFMPALLFFVCPLLSPRFRKNRVFLWFSSSLLATVVLYVCGTSDFGGWCYGYRFLIPFAPAMLLWIVLFFGKPRRLVFYRVFRACLAIGVLVALVGTCNPWNAGYEGSSTPKGALPNHFKNSFLANSYVFLWEHAPDSFLTSFFQKTWYGYDVSMLYLLMEFNNRNDKEMLRFLLDKQKDSAQ